MKKILLAVATMVLIACSSTEQKKEQISESEAMEKITEDLEKAKSEIKEISKDIDSKLDEAIKKIESDEKK